MFQVIEPQEHHLYQSTINSFLKKLQAVNALKKHQDLKQAICFYLFSLSSLRRFKKERED